MKKIFLLITIIFSLAIAEQVKANCAACIYEEPGGSIIEGISTIEGEVYDVVDKKISYHKIEVLDDDWKKEKIGWAWSVKIANGEVIDQGVTFRKQPSKDAEIIGGLKPGRKVKILQSIITWYKIAQGWVFNTRMDKM